MTTIINGSSPSVTFSDGSTQNTSAVVGTSVPYSLLPTGSVLQVVQSTSSTTTSTTSSTYVTTGLSASITPKFSTSKILILVNGVTYAAASAVFGFYTIFRGTVAGTNLSTNGFNIIGNSNSDSESTSAMSYLDSPATTSATTYTVGMKTAGSGTITWAANNGLGVITLMEIAG